MKKINKKENKPSIKPLIIVIVSVLVIVILGIVVAYAWNQGEVIKERNEKISELQKKVSNLTDYIENLQVNSGQATNQQQNQIQSKIGPWPEYINDTFGFSLIFPQTWENYLVAENDNFIDFGFESQNPVVRVSVIGHEQWDQIREEENNGLVYVGENDQYVIVYSLAAQTVDENIQSLVSEFSGIIENLDLTDGELIIKNYDEEQEDFTYSNEAYGFSLDFPGTWSNYEVKERVLNFGEDGSANSIDFYFEKGKAIFNIGFIEKGIWDSVKDLSYYQAIKLGETKEYVLGYAISSRADSNFVVSLQNDIDIIKASFQVSELIEEENNLSSDQSLEDDAMIDTEDPEMNDIDDPSLE
jgi:hypothetical protein